MFRALRKTRARKLFSDAVDEWLIHIQQFSICTQDSYKRHILAFQAKIPNKPISKISPLDFRTYLNEVYLRCQIKSSANMPLVALKSFGRFLFEMYGIENPARDIKKFKVAEKLRHFLTKSEYKKILSVCSPRQKDILITLAMTGVRASELVGLTWDNIDDSYSRLTIIGKGSKIRVIPLNETVRSVLFKYPRQAGTHIIFLPKNTKNLYRTCRLVGDKVGIHLNPHLLRHFFATELLRKGVKIAFVAKLLGDTIAVTEKFYIHFLPDYLLGTTDVLD